MTHDDDDDDDGEITEGVGRIAQRCRHWNICSSDEL